MDWIKSYKRLEKSGKLIFVAKKLMINRYQAIGHLHSLWWWASENAEDGNITKFPKSIIGSVSGWDEHIREKEQERQMLERMIDEDYLPEVPLSETFLDVLVECGFVDETKEGRFIHNWETHYGEYFAEKDQIEKRRIVDRERLKRWREKEKRETKRFGNVSKTVKKRKEEVKKEEVKETTKNKDITLLPELPPNAFDAIWQRFPRRLGKHNAERSFKAQVRTKQDWLDINNALDRFKAKLNKEATEEKFIPHGSTWFNNRWRDWVSYEEAGNASNGGTSVSQSPLERTRAREAEEIRKRELASK